jgi:metal-sulfur cluster biosynthetic enzyme
MHESLTLSTPLQVEIASELDQIFDPCSVGTGSPMGMVEMGLIRSIDIAPDGRVAIELRLTSPFCEMIGFLKSEALAKVAALEGVNSVVVTSDSGFDWTPDAMSPAGQVKRAHRLEQLGIPTRRTQDVKTLATAEPGGNR